MLCKAPPPAKPCIPSQHAVLADARDAASHITAGYRSWRRWEGPNSDRSRPGGKEQGQISRPWDVKRDVPRTILLPASAVHSVPAQGRLVAVATALRHAACVPWPRDSERADLHEQKVRQLLQQALQLASVRNVRAASTILWALAKLPARIAQQHGLLAVAIAQAFVQQVRYANAQDVSMTMWALAALEQKPPAQWLNATLNRMHALLPQAAPQALSNCVWALARLGLPVPGGSWMDDFARHSLACMPEFSSQGLSNLAWALATLGHALPADWLAAFHAAVLAKLPVFNPQALATTLRALVCLSRRCLLPPPPFLVSALVAELQRQLRWCEPVDIANSVWALAALQQRPAKEQVAALLAAAQPMLPRCSLEQLSCLLWGLARLGETPNRAWLAEYALAVEAHLSRPCEPRTASSLLHSLAHMGLRPPSRMQAALLDSLSGRLGSLEPQTVSCTLWALAKMQYRPPQEWVEDLLHSTWDGVAAYGLREVSMTFVALGELQVKPPDRWTVRLVSQAWHSSRRGIPAEQRGAVVTLLRGLAKLRVRSQALMVARLLALAQPHVTQYSVRELSHLAWALGRIRQPDSPARRTFLSALQRSCATRLDQANSQDMAMLVLGLAKRWVPLRHSLRDALLARTAAILGEFNSFELATLLWSLQHLHKKRLMPQSVPVRWMRRLWRVTLPGLHGLRPQQMAALLVACASMWQRPPRMWMDVACAAVLHQMHHYQARDIVRTLLSLTRMCEVPSEEFANRLLQQLHTKVTTMTREQLGVTRQSIALLRRRGLASPQLQENVDFLESIWDEVQHIRTVGGMPPQTSADIGS